MKLANWIVDGRADFGVVTAGGPTDGSAISGSGFDPALRSVDDVLRAGALDGLKKWATGRQADVALAGVTLREPVLAPRKVVCIGINYVDHRSETGFDAQTYPPIFIRWPSTHVAHEEPVVVPSISDKFDYEGELAAVIGRPVYRETPEQAADAVAGWSVYNDGTVRDYQLHTSQWTPGKNFPRSGGFGPWLVTCDEAGPTDAMHLQTRVNGETLQDADVSDLIFTVPQLISYISAFAPLEPGDVIATGTPSGVGGFRNPTRYLRPGDVLEVEITGVGTLRHPVVAEST
jgi:2-keto-4-pentenoate hydratase/2-oxohepta-3-ene-1,7-dioic acid hydratase in catechol pathway